MCCVVVVAVKMRWQLLDVKGDLPCPRHSHAAAAVGDKLFIFGGTDGKQLLNDVYVFDTTTCVWTRPEVLGGIAPRIHSAFDVYEHLVVFFGGQGSSGDLGDTVAFDTSTRRRRHHHSSLITTLTS